MINQKIKRLLMMKFRTITLLISCFVLTVIATVSAQDEDQIQRWLDDLQAFEMPEPGPISAEVAELKRRILMAPLEEMPPEVRTGYALQQINIHYHDGNWDGVQELRNLITHSDQWVTADQDAEVLSRIASFDSGVVFPAPGGRASGQDKETFRDISIGYWERNYQNWDQYYETLETIADTMDPDSIRVAVAILRFAKDSVDGNDLERAELLLAKLQVNKMTNLHGVGYYDKHGRYISADEVLSRFLVSAESMHQYVCKAIAGEDNLIKAQTQSENHIITTQTQTLLPTQRHHLPIIDPLENRPGNQIDKDFGVISPAQQHPPTTVIQKHGLSWMFVALIGATLILISMIFVIFKRN